MQYITLLDYVLLPFYVALIYLVAINIRNRKYPEGHPWRPYFISGLTAKIGGALFISFIYQYYYGGGDTANYYLQSQVVNSAFAESSGKWLNLLLHIPKWYDADYIMYTSQLVWYNAISEYTIVAIAAFINVFTFNSYLPAAILFSVVSFSGLWALFRTFAGQYPQYTKAIAVACLFIPSTIVWGSGLFKDTICMFGLGWMVYSSFQLLIKRNFSLSNIGILILSFYLIALIKIYILMAFIPALILWILFMYSDKIPGFFGRWIVRGGVIAVCFVGLQFVALRYADELGKYSLDSIGKTAQITSTYLQYVSQDTGGSGYSLGDFDPSIAGMLKKFFPAVNVTLFRPYLWEAGKAIQLLSAIEALLFLFITLKVLFTVGLPKVWSTIMKDANIQFFLIFTLVFSFAVGISASNFGTLSRYKIPCLPFYVMALVLIYYKNVAPGKRLLGRIL